MDSIYIEMLTTYPETRSDYNEAFLRYNALRNQKNPLVWLTKNEEEYMRYLLSKCISQKTVARQVRYKQKKFPELNYTKEEAEKRAVQEQECRDTFRIYEVSKSYIKNITKKFNLWK